MQIKVAHVVRQYHPSIGGMEDVVQNIAQSNVEHHGISSKIITLNRLFTQSGKILNAEEEVDGIPIVRLPYCGSRRYPLCPQVLHQLSDADVIHVHGVDFFFDYLALTKGLHRRPLVASTHGGFFHTRFMPRLKQLYFRTITRASSQMYDRIVATSNNDGRIFSEIIRQPRLEVIENGVNVIKFQDLAAAQPTPTMIYFGRWSKNKEIPATLALFEQLHAADPVWRLIIAGREYDHHASDLQAMVTERNLSHAVDIVPNPENLELANLIRKASYFICLSSHEGFGIAPIEAMSAGLIPLLSTIPPFRELVERSNLGLLIDPARPELAIAALQALHAGHTLEFEQDRRRLQAFAARYDWRNIAGQYAEIYSSLVSAQ